MAKISSLVFLVKTFWVFEWMTITNGVAISKNPEYFITLVWLTTSSGNVGTIFLEPD
jgi:hypothetical protein